jgi:hypothetical protein
MATIAPLLTDLLRAADERLLSGWYRAISVPAESVRQQLRQSGLAYLDPTSGQADLSELDRSARWVIDQARHGATALGGIAGLGGLASVPPEVVAQLVSGIRLGQRLAVIYGFDPATDRGRMALFRALADGYEVELPEGGPVGMRISELPSIVAPAFLQPRTVPAALIGEIIRKSAWTLAARLTRVVPVISAGSSAVHARRGIAETGRRMHQTLRKLAGLRPSRLIEEAVEVG